ncbi:MAG: LamG domain-containing protein [Candidatus Brocadiaceae bacterium]|nr:LamG domain-containing protein [Candidatus Brocadiaceae bacterium]
MKMSIGKTVCVLFFLLPQILFLHKAELLLAQSTDDSWKNFFAVKLDDSEKTHAKYAKQMGYSSIIIRDRTNVASLYRNNPDLVGLKFFLGGPEYYRDVMSGYDRTIDTTKKYSQQEQNFYNDNMVWKSKDPFPRNLATGYFTSKTEFQVRWDFQQQRVIDELVENIIQFAKSIEDKSANFMFGGYMFDVPRLVGGFTYWEPQNRSNNQICSLSYWTGKDSGLAHGNITHEYATYSEGHAAFYKKLNTRMRKEFPDVKWVVHPWKIHDDWYDSFKRPYIDEWIKQIKGRYDKDELTADMMFQEKAGTEFADDGDIFNSGVKITRDRVGISQPLRLEGVKVYENRLYAAKAGIHGSWYNWYNRYSDDPKFTAITRLYPHFKLIRCLPNWDNLNKVPLAERSWDGKVYQSTHSYADDDVMYSRQPKTGKLFAVFMTKNGVIRLNRGETVTSMQHTDGYFIESGNASADFNITGDEIRLRDNVRIAVDSNNGQVEGNGYIFTLSSSPQTGGSLQAHYKFNEGSGLAATDSSGNGNNGTINGAEWSAGQSGAGLEFDGVNDSVDFATNLGISGELTVSAWVYPTVAPNGDGRVIASTYEWNNTASLRRGWSLGIDNGSTDRIQFMVYDRLGKSASTNIDNFFADNLNRWTLVTGVFKPSQYARMYVNGTMVSEETVDVPAAIAYAAGTNLRIGMRADSSSLGMWRGGIDEVRIYDRVLTNKEISDLYIPPQQAGAIQAHYKFNEGSGLAATDSSGNGNNGTINGAEWSAGQSGAGLDFDGINDSVDFTTNLGISGELTVSAWVYPTVAPNGDGRVIAATYEWSSTETLRRGWSLGIDSGSADRILFRVHDSSGKSVSTDIDNFFADNLNRWTLVTGVFKPSQYARMYVNGTMVSEETVDVPAAIAYAAGINLRIGMRADTSSLGMWRGGIDEVRIYDRALTNKEVSDLYTPPQQTVNSQAHYKFNEGSGLSARDSSGNGNDGTINGARWSAGKSGSGLDFDGINDSVDFTTNLGINAGLTVSAWVYPTAAPNENGRVIATTYYWDENDALLRGWTLGTNSGSTDSIYFRLYNSSGTRSTTSFSNFFAENLNKWTLVTGVFKPSQYTRLYVNGVMVAEDTSNIFSSIGYAAGTNLRIGMRADSSTLGMWQGGIDEVQIYDHALTDQEVLELFNNF